MLIILGLAACSGKKDGTIATEEGVKFPPVCIGENCPPVVKPKLD